MNMRAVAILCLCTVASAAGCSSTSQTVGSAEAASAPTVSATYADPPVIDAGMSVDTAYAAIPHRRTVWIASTSTASPGQQAYLSTMFQTIDQAIALRVAGLQNYSRGEFGSVNVDGGYDRLLTFARATAAPAGLERYHEDVVSALSRERQFFQEWNANRGGFAYAEHYENHPAVRAASAAARDAYNELVKAFPNEPQGNKDAFFDYHCALDFL